LKSCVQLVKAESVFRLGFFLDFGKPRKAHLQLGYEPEIRPVASSSLMFTALLATSPKLPAASLSKVISGQENCPLTSGASRNIVWPFDGGWILTRLTFCAL
jgi:hypothetical protein